MTSNPDAPTIAAIEAEQEQRVNDRQAAMTALWTTELENDHALLIKPWEDENNPPADLDSYEYAESWFEVGNIDGSARSILQSIGHYITARLPVAERNDIVRTLDDPRYKDRNFHFVGAKDDIINPAEDSPSHMVKTILEDTGSIGAVAIDLSTDLPWFLTEKGDPGRETWEDSRDNAVYVQREDKPATTILNLYDTAQLWQSIREIWRLMERLRIMRRFSDGRNPELTAKPLPDGSNIPSKEHALLTSWTLHRAWIRLLHYRTLFVRNKASGIDDLMYIEQLAMGLLMIELKDVGHYPVASQNNPKTFRRIKQVYDDLFDCVVDLGRFIATESRNDGINHTDADTRKYNLHPDRLRPFAENSLMPAINLDPTWKLWGPLLSKAAEFDIASDVLHVEDALVTKRVAVMDEWYSVAEALKKPFKSKAYLTFGFPQSEQFERNVNAMLQSTSEINRLRRNKLLMTQWNGSRPWKQLYIMYDTSPTGKPELATLIENFWVRMEFIDRNHPNVPPRNPSNKGNIWRQLFPIHPLASTDPPSAGRLGNFYEGSCGICMEDFSDTTNRVLGRLHCDHWFHFTCMRKYFDMPDLISFRCALCRTSGYNWHLHDHTGITPETRALDVWDYEELMGAAWIQGTPAANGVPANDPHPDLDARYHDRDREMLAMSRLWSKTTGYPAVDMNDPFNRNAPGFVRGGGAVDPNRVPAIEMAIWRKRRRDRIKKRAADVEAARGGFFGLDPAEEDALV